MTKRIYPRPCANPVCGRPIEDGQIDSVELLQVWPAETTNGETFCPRYRWCYCNIECLRQHLDLALLRDRVAAAEVEP